ncbi:hypothetical protein LUZ60_005742 [Juncus effusus]|nr:hypothetical protein LUZ60_005742 [Juncus effusus]
MAEGRRYGFAPQLDIEQILMEAQHRWLRPAEICEILKNYKRFRIAPEPPNRPPSGSLFLFDRKVLRYFRKDGHNWRKKKDGKTIKEAHERLKSGSIDVLHCYYAHGEDNECFQRRSYWMLEEDFMHIVLVHYLEVKGGKSSLHRTRDIELSTAARSDSPLNSNSFTTQSQSQSQQSYGQSQQSYSQGQPYFHSEPESSISGPNSEFEDAESVLQFNASCGPKASATGGYNAFPQTHMVYGDGRGPMMMNNNIVQPNHGYNNFLPVNNQSIGGTSTGTNLELYFSQEDLATAFGEPGLGSTSTPSNQYATSAWADVANQSNFTPQTQIQIQTQMPFEMSFNSNNNNPVPFVTEDIKLDSPIFDGVFANELGPPQVNAPAQSLMEFLPDSNNNNYSLQDEKIINEPIVDLNPNLEKGDSFNRWMSTELIGDHSFSEPIKSNSDSLWNSVETDGVLDDTGVSSNSQLEMFAVGPVISQDQLFSIVDYSPNWAYVGRNTKVLVAGKFLKRIDEVQKCKWSCMFGEIEVSADLLHDGTLRCYSPSHSPGRVPFYVTCSNRLACSEIREFEFRDLNSQFPYNFTENETDLSARLEKLLTLDPNSQQNLTNNNEVCNKINGLMTEEDEWSVLFKANESDGVFADAQKDERVEGMMKEKLRVWLLSKVNEEGKGPCVLDKEGQGAIHLAAALGFDWAVRPIITAGVSVNFRDAHGWTALHWAASCGRERTVVALIALGADPGALTDPTPEFPSGRTPADLASNNGHKGISGFLAESSLTSLLEILTLKDPNKGNADLAQICKVKKSVRFEDDGGGNMNEDGSLKDSLSAVRNAAQAASRIYQVFRMQSFQRKQLDQLDGEGGLGISDERALAKAMKAPAVAYGSPYQEAAIRIQNKFRGYKGRKEFLLIKQRIVKLQAHVRGHQVRKHYRKIIWSVGIVEKIILRWRRKGSGLRGFKPDPSPSGSAPAPQPGKEEADELDFLKEGRRQTEARLEKALARVKSMVQYPEARAQYGRLLTTITQLQESQEKILKEAEAEADVDDFMVELKDLWEDDTPMFGF